MKVERDALETPHLKIATRVIKEWARTPSGQGFKYEHIVLSITNRTDKPVAYYVPTTVSHPENCQSQGAIEHNAIALKPGETGRAHRVPVAQAPDAARRRASRRWS